MARKVTVRMAFQVSIAGDPGDELPPKVKRAFTRLRRAAAVLLSLRNFSADESHLTDLAAATESMANIARRAKAAGG